MKESIFISDFLVIKKADIEVRKINLIIGPQANGKSVIAKLLHFFKSISGEFLQGIRNNKTKRELDEDILSNFEKKFPRYSWDGTSFIINYTVDDITVSIEGKKNSRGKTSLKISYSSNLSRLFSSKKKVYAKKLEEYKEQEGKKAKAYPSVPFTVFLDQVVEPINNGKYDSFFSESVFVPASRTFFSNLQKNIFTFLASNLDIDPFLKEFGSLYENSKRWYKGRFLRSRDDNSLLGRLYKNLEAVVDGDYEYHDEQDWIRSNDKRINLANASSGQQESLPMLLVMCVWPMIHADENGGMFFIEEPEAHLFPTSQGLIVSMLSLLYSELGTNFFLTSHSPYILSALNNFILAGDVVNDNKMTNEEFLNLNKSGAPIQFDDVSAYTIVDGVVTSIKDEEYRMVGGDILDGISDHFEHVMNKLLTCGE